MEQHQTPTRTTEPFCFCYCSTQHSVIAQRREPDPTPPLRPSTDPLLPERRGVVAPAPAPASALRLLPNLSASQSQWSEQVGGTSKRAMYISLRGRLAGSSRPLEFSTPQQRVVPLTCFTRMPSTASGPRKMYALRSSSVSSPLPDTCLPGHWVPNLRCSFPSICICTAPLAGMASRSAKPAGLLSALPLPPPSKSTPVVCCKVAVFTPRL